MSATSAPNALPRSLTNEPVWVSLSTYFATAHESNSTFWFAKAFSTLCTTTCPVEYQKAWHTCNECLLTSDCETPVHVYELFLSIRNPETNAAIDSETEAEATRENASSTSSLTTTAATSIDSNCTTRTVIAGSLKNSSDPAFVAGAVEIDGEQNSGEQNIRYYYFSMDEGNGDCCRDEDASVIVDEGGFSDSDTDSFFSASDAREDPIGANSNPSTTVEDEYEVFMEELNRRQNFTRQ